MKRLTLTITGAVLLAGFTSAAAMDTMSTGTMMKTEKMATTTMMHDDKMMMNDEMETMYEKTSNKSKTEDIAKLQMMLVEKGHLKMPSGVKYGYYGNLTKKAYAKYKEAKMMMKKEMSTSTTMMHDDKMMHN